MEQDLISIIIPCYNASRYLNDVFLSIKNQTYQNLEVIFVDDGSTDETGKMLDEFAEEYSKAKIIHKENGDVSSARNVGIKKAKGKFLYFLDSDDIIHPDTISYLHDLIIKYNADVVSHDFKRVSPKTLYVKLKVKNVHDSPTSIFVTADSVYTNFLTDINHRAVWAKLFSHEIIKKVPGYPNVFDEKFNYGEDALFLFNYYKYCRRLVVSKEKLYFYRQIKTSKVHSTFNDNDSLISQFELVLNQLDSIIYKESRQYIPGVMCLYAMDLIRKLSYSEYHNQKVANEIYHCYRDNLKYLPHLSHLPYTYRFGTLFTLPVMYLMIRKKLKG